MATKLKIRKVNTLPGTYEASTLYIVKSSEATLFELYMSTSDGTAVRHIYNKAEITAQIATSLASVNNATVVPTIAARNALAPTTNVFVLVADASGDPTVNAGAASYVYDLTNTSWVKIHEYEGLDYVFNWASLADKPTSTVAAIDAAVSASHTHANKVELDKIDEDANGFMIYNGQPIRAHLEVDEW